MRLVEPTKVCSNEACALAGIRQPWSAFGAREAWEDGTIRLPRSRCKACRQAENRERRRQLREADPERAREAYRRRYAKLKDDPERMAIWRVYQREAKRRRLGITPDRYRVGHVEARGRGGEPLDPAPFVAWLRTLGANAELIALECGLSPRRVLALLDGEYGLVATDVVDYACLRAGAHIDDVYPWEEVA